MRKARVFRFLSVLALVGLMSHTAWAVQGSAYLEVTGANSTPTHWDIPIAVPTTATICGVSTAEVGDPLPATIDVWVKSTEFGNTLLTATRVGITDCYEFTYTPPSTSCNTTIVAYGSLGLNSNNDLADDGIINGSGISASGFRFVDGNGDPIECAVAVDDRSWSAVKNLFR